MQKKMLLLAAAAAAILSMGSVPSFGAISDIYGNTTAGGGGSQGGNYTETGTVTSILNSTSTANTFTIADGTGSVIAYSIAKTNYTPTVGDNITFSAYNVPYYGAPELVNNNSTAGADTFSATINSTGNAVSPPVITIAQMNASVNGSYPVPPLSEAIVTLDNVTFTTAPASLAAKTTYTISDSTGTGDLYTYTSYGAVVTSDTASNAANPGGYTGTYDITGYVDPYSATLAEIYPLSITAVPEPASLGALAIGALGLMARRRRVDRI